jgi:hypothetical protein
MAGATEVLAVVVETLLPETIHLSTFVFRSEPEDLIHILFGGRVFHSNESDFFGRAPRNY